eukprot:TRINITY_DN90515_c0_g1_i1.p1 TRINITY_DN90515_c0_g1~~TRINITY_DN90515_c0_g1_i1.p1  ORF type:complete len:963 (+),score=268.56 TRINITY_DN90515_c0_g1_i1:300-2891(+)
MGLSTDADVEARLRMTGSPRHRPVDAQALLQMDSLADRLVQSAAQKQEPGAASSAEEAPPVSGAASMQIQSGQHGICITNERPAGASARQVTATPCHIREDQKWFMERKMLKSKWDGQCVTLSDTGIALRQCLAADDQLWGLDEKDRIVSLSKNTQGLCLEIPPPVDGQASQLLGATCHSGLSQKWKMKSMTPRISVVQENAECEQGREFLGKFKTADECMNAVKEKGAWYFNFGKSGADYGKCYKVAKMVTGTDHTCTPMFSTSAYDFWVVEPGAEANLISLDTSCMASESDMGLIESLEKCVEEVRTQGGRYVVYGKERDARRCFKKNTQSRTCPEGLIRNATYDFFEITTFQHIVGLEAELIKPDAVCRSGDQDMGLRETPMACMQALVKDSPTVQAKGTAFFAYGKGVKDEECMEEYTSTKDCTEGFERNAHYDFYRVVFSEAELVKSNARCKSHKESLGEFESPEECLAMGKKKNARFISYGKFTSVGECYKDYASSSECPDGGFEPQLYDMYRLIVTEAQCKMPAGIQYAAQYTCMEGLLISHGEKCTPRCQAGYAPSVASMSCIDGDLKPATFNCVEAEGENREASALSEASLQQRGSASSRQKETREAGRLSKDTLLEERRLEGSSGRREVQQHSHGEEQDSEGPPGNVESGEKGTSTKKQQKDEAFKWTKEGGLQKLDAEDLQEQFEPTEEHPMAREEPGGEGSGEDPGGDSKADGMVMQGGTTASKTMDGAVVLSSTADGMPPPVPERSKEAAPDDEDDNDEVNEEQERPKQFEMLQGINNEAEDKKRVNADKFGNKLGDTDDFEQDDFNDFTLAGQFQKRRHAAALGKSLLEDENAAAASSKALMRKEGTGV